MSSRPKIVLDETDFSEPESTPSAPVSPPRPAAPPAPSPSPSPSSYPELPVVNRGTPLAVGVYPKTQATGNPSGQQWLTNPSSAPLIAAAAGVLLAWAVTELLGIADVQATSKLGADAATGAWTGVIGVIFGGVLLAFDSAVGGAWDVAARRFAAAAVPMFGAGFIAGLAANALYLQIVQSALEHTAAGEGITANSATFYLARSVGWALFGAGVGITVGLLGRSRQRTINSGLGGALGGTAGGLLFQYVAVNAGTSDSTSRLIGLIGIGALIALATRAVETARREAWLQVRSGGMIGKEFILYHAITRLGSSPDCEIFLLKDPSVEKLHAQITVDGDRRVLTAMPGAVVNVNGTQVATQPLRNGDELQIGGTTISYSERALARPMPA
jgi:hypothetical protein